MKLASTTAATLAPRICEALHTAPKTPCTYAALEHVGALFDIIVDLEEMCTILYAEQRAKKDEGH